jgi:acetyltransferase-like isoleucine patch superfamily enzyme
MLGRIFLKLYRSRNLFGANAFSALSRGAFGKLGAGSILTPPIRLGGEKWISIGEGVFIGSGSWLQVVSHAGERGSKVITIGDHAALAGFCTITAVKSVVIESKVLIARNVYISDHSHGHISREHAIIDQGLSDIAPVRISEGAWLGQGVVICPGVTIGRNAVIGANSVVRKDVPDYCIAAGAPARLIRMIDSEPLPQQVC